MQTLDNQKTFFSEKRAEQLALEYFNIIGQAHKLPGELAENFLIQTGNGEAFTLKIAPSDEDRQHLEMQNALMRHFEKKETGLELPRLVAGSNEEDITIIEDAGGQARMMRMLVWVPGQVLAKVNPHTPELLESLGAACGKLCQALQDFDHPGAHLWHKWDLAKTAWVEEHLQLMEGQEQQALANYFFQLFQKEVAPKLDSLRHSVIYNDANDYNVLVDENLRQPRVKGVIDFGDAVYTCVINELAIAITYSIMDKARPLEAVAHVVRGFHGVFPLKEEEVALLYTLVAARLLLSVTVGAINRKENPENKYLLISQRPAWDLLKKWKEIAPALAHYTFREACGWEPCPQKVAFEKWVLENQAAFSPVVIFENEKVEALNLSVGSLDLGNNADFETIQGFEKTIDRMLEEAGASFGIGGYGEVRPFYTTDAYMVMGNSGPQWRTVHIGVDVWSKAGTPVFAPLDGTVHSFQDNAGDCNYGSTIILEHRISEILTFYTLYGHLSRESLNGLEVGKKIEKGGQIASTGTSPVNGNWPPHLHFQVMLDMLEMEGDFPGVAFPEEQNTWLSICPDGAAFFPDANFGNSTFSAHEILLIRRQNLGKSLSISYRRPLHIVRGYMQYLYDDTGRRYLDTVNNVAHVGHEHPRVVRAAQRQMAVLNTNTRYLHQNIALFAEELLATFPSELSVVFFVNSGSEANELALRMARHFTGQKDMVAVEAGYHGNTGGCIAISSYKFDGKGGKGAPQHTQVVPIPDTYRGIYRKGSEAGKEYASHIQQAIDKVKQQGRGIAGFICESILSCGGQVVLPDGYLAAAYQYIREAGGLCIADEVQVGFGRVGERFWGFELQGVMPDIVTMGKPIGNGHPLAAVVTTQKVANTFANGMEYFNTFGGNPVSCAAGREVLRIIQEDGLEEHAREVGAYLTEGLTSLQKNHQIIGDVRGAGLFLGFELVTDRATLKPASAEAAYLSNRMREHGILMSTDGPFENVLKIKPPMCFNKANADFLLETLGKVLKEDFLKK